jgi:hypothetical protein
MKTGLAGNQPANIRMIRRRNTGSAPAYALETMEQHSHFKKWTGETLIRLTTDNHIRGEGSRSETGGSTSVGTPVPVSKIKTEK